MNQTKQKRSCNYRYPNEIRTLIVTVILALIAIFIFTDISLGLFFFLLVFAVLANYIYIYSQIQHLKRSAVMVSETQFPEIKALIDECRQYIDISPDTMVFITHSTQMNAFAMGIKRPYVIVLYSALVEAMDQDELKSVIGHEMGHIKFGHTRLLTILGELGNQSFGIPFIGSIIAFCFHFWMRSAEFSADRAGLVACANLDKAIMTEVKLGVGPELAKKVNLEALAKQAHEAHGSIVGTLGDLGKTHALMTTRIQQIADFATSDTFRHLRPEAGNIGANEAERWKTKRITEEDSKQVKICPACKKTVEDNVLFCSDCGNELNEAILSCTQCQTRLEKSWKVCPRCGTKNKTFNDKER